MPLFTAAGSRLFIGSARPDWIAGPVTPSAVEGEEWLEVGQLLSLGSIGGEWATDTAIYPNNDDAESAPYEHIEKTVQPMRRMQVVMGSDALDAGQVALVAAYYSTDNFMFRLSLPDGSDRIFVGLVVGMDEDVNSSDDVLMLSFSMTLNGGVLRREDGGGVVPD